MRQLLFILLLLQGLSGPAAHSSDKSLVHRWVMSEAFKAFLDEHIGQFIIYKGPDGYWYQTLVVGKDEGDNYTGVKTSQVSTDAAAQSSNTYGKGAFKKVNGKGGSGGGLAGDLAGSALKSGALIMLEEGVLDLLGITDSIEKYAKELVEHNTEILKNKIKMREIFGLIYERVTTLFSGDVIYKNALLIRRQDLKSLDQGHVDYLKELLGDMNAFTDNDGSFLNKTMHVSESLLHQISTPSPRALRIKIVGVELLKYAKTSAGVGTIGDAIYFAKFANGIANMMNHSLSPFSDVASIYYDLYEAVTGYSATSSSILHPSERAFSFYKFVSNTGLGKKFKWASKALGKIVKKIPGARVGWERTLKYTSDFDHYAQNSQWREVWQTWGEQIESTADNLKFIEQKFRKFQKLTDKWELIFEFRGDELKVTAKDTEGVLPNKVYVY